jgi:short-subunit dehydrogenase
VADENALVRELKGTRALLTGAASGIGRALALELAASGVHLYLADVDGEGLRETVRRVEPHGVVTRTWEGDLADPARVDELAHQALQDWGSLQLLINNAGVAYYGSTRRMSDEQWDRLLGVNLLAPVRLTRRLLPMLCEQGDGHVVNLCSYLGLVAIRRATAYSTSKFGLVGFSLALRNDYARHFGVTAVCPGYVDTPLFARMETSRAERPQPPAWCSVSPERVAKLTLRGVRRDQPLVVVTQMAKWSWLASRLAPGWFNRRHGRRRRPLAPPPRPHSPQRGEGM